MSNSAVRFEAIIPDFVPENAVEEVIRLWKENPYQLRITNERKTKKGDFRADIRGNVHHISVNNNLNSYEFLLVLIHEYAHLLVWKIYGRKAKSHGIEWKNQFRIYMLPFFDLVEFPQELKIALLNYLKNPKASSGADINLQKAFSVFDPPTDKILVEDLEENTLFVFNNRLFKRKQKLRVRYMCEEMSSRRNYRFSPLAPVEIYESN